MKNIILIVVVLATAALWLGWSTNKPTLKNQIAEGIIPSASFEKSKKVESKNTATEIISNSAENIRLSDALEQLETVTEEYNRKALIGELTAEDEVNYEKATKLASIAFEQYQKAAIQKLKSMGDI